MKTTVAEITDSILKSNPDISGPELHKRIEETLKKQEPEIKKLTPRERQEQESIAQEQCRECKEDCELKNQIGLCILGPQPKKENDDA